MLENTFRAMYHNSGLVLEEVEEFLSSMLSQFFLDINSLHNKPGRTNSDVGRVIQRAGHGRLFVIYLKNGLLFPAKM